MPIDNIQLDVQERKSSHREAQPSPYELDETEKVFKWDDKVLAADSPLLPLLPGKRIQFRLHILGKLTQ